MKNIQDSGQMKKMIKKRETWRDKEDKMFGYDEGVRLLNGEK